MIKIKICGITSQEEAQWLLEESVEYVGLVLFYEKSKRYVSVEQAFHIMRLLKTQTKWKIPQTVAVTVSPVMEQIEIIKKLGFDYVQIHGELSKDVMENITLPVIRAVNHFDSEEYAALCACEKIRGILVDASIPGSGCTFDWETLSNYKRNPGKLLFLAGGLCPGNVADAIEAVHPDVVDVSSGVEGDTVKTGKDRLKIREFTKNARKAGYVNE